MMRSSAGLELIPALEATKVKKLSGDRRFIQVGSVVFSERRLTALEFSGNARANARVLSAATKG